MKEAEFRAQVILDAKVLNNPFWQGTRITEMLNLAQRWVQLKLIKQGNKNWRKEASNTLGDSTLLGVNTSISTIITDRLYDMPLYIAKAGTEKRLPVKISEELFLDIVDNILLKPTSDSAVFIEIDTVFHLYPRVTAGSAKVVYTKVVTDLVLDAVTESEIPDENLEEVISRVVMQIKSAMDQEDIKQVKLTEANQEIAGRYQVDAIEIKDGVTE